jgi:hypothetical protein
LIAEWCAWLIGTAELMKKPFARLLVCDRLRLLLTFSCSYEDGSAESLLALEDECDWEPEFDLQSTMAQALLTAGDV